MSTSPNTIPSATLEEFLSAKAQFLQRARAATIADGYVEGVFDLDQEMVRTREFIHYCFI
jgi:hypothetical protein